MFVVDEVGQFVARDVQKMLDLQAVVQSLGVKGRGKHWVVVTSQEKLGELVSGLDDKKIELARLMDRFPLQVHLEPSDISEVTSRRVLSKNAAAQAALGELFDEHRGRLTEHTRLTADIKLPELTRDSFIDLYPLLPYQIDLIIQVVSGLRTQGGASKHVGGANRTIIKLAQQLLINPAVDLADAAGRRRSCGSIRSTTSSRGTSAPRCARRSPRSRRRSTTRSRSPSRRSICLLQYVKSVHRTRREHRGRAAPERRRRLAARGGEGGAARARGRAHGSARRRRLPHPDAGRGRLGAACATASARSPATRTASTRRCCPAFWQPQPSHTLFDTKTFKAGLAIHGREVVDGDMMFHVHLAEDGEEFEALAAELRTRSQQERKQRLLGRRAQRRDRSRDRRAVPLEGDAGAQGARERRRRRDRRSSPRRSVRQRRHRTSCGAC